MVSKFMLTSRSLELVPPRHDAPSSYFAQNLIRHWMEAICNSFIRTLTQLRLALELYLSENLHLGINNC